MGNFRIEMAAARAERARDDAAPRGRWHPVGLRARRRADHGEGGTEVIDTAKCLRAMQDLDAEGVPDTSARLGVIEEAIAAIQRDGSRALRDEYLGVKNCAHFGDQRSDHPYGYGPKHGYIVFRVGTAVGTARAGYDRPTL